MPVACLRRGAVSVPDTASVRDALRRVRAQETKKAGPRGRSGRIGLDSWAETNRAGFRPLKRFSFPTDPQAGRRSLRDRAPLETAVKTEKLGSGRRSRSGGGSRLFTSSGRSTAIDRSTGRRAATPRTAAADGATMTRTATHRLAGGGLTGSRGACSGLTGSRGASSGLAAGARTAAADDAATPRSAGGGLASSRLTGSRLTSGRLTSGRLAGRSTTRLRTTSPSGVRREGEAEHRHQGDADHKFAIHSRILQLTGTVAIGSRSKTVAPSNSPP
jgi:hypothetical protein